MSLRRESDEEANESLLDHLETWYHIPALALIMVVMLWIRLIPYHRFIRKGHVLFSGNDPWYHLREVQYTVRHWPGTMPFDPWTYFPFGTSTGQFGTLYDQIVATIALILGLGHPGHELVSETLLVAPAVFGALAAIPVYLVGKRLAGRLGGLFGAVVLMLLPGTFLQRTLVGVADHNGVEPFFQCTAVFALMTAFVVAERDMPIWELVEDRDWDALRRPMLWAVFAGVATALYMWVWPPGVLLVSIVGIFLVVKITSDVVNGGTPEPVAFAGAVAMVATAVMMLIPLKTLDPSPTKFSILQPALALAVAVGAVFLGWLARYFERRDADQRLYAVAVFGLIAVVAGVLSVVLPHVFHLFVNNLLRIVGFSANAATRTIAEAQPFLSPNRTRGIGATGVILNQYGLTFFTAVAAAVWLTIKPLVRDGKTREYSYVGIGLAIVLIMFLVPSVLAGIEKTFHVDAQLLGLAIVTALIVGATLMARYSAAELFVLSWAAFIAAAAFTQVRFNYYLALAVAVMNAYLLGEVLRSLDLTGSAAKLIDRIEGYQILVVAAVILLVVTPALVVPVSVGSGQSATAIGTASGSGPGPVTNWEGTLHWMQNNTPQEGNYGNANNTQDLQYYGTYKRQKDFSYPKGAYGVMSWWDYGHWITVEGHRIPNANPFQQGAVKAADFLLSTNESQARHVLQSYDSPEGNQTRYVMVDWQMASPSSKFSAPVVFYDSSKVSQSDFYSPIYRASQQSGVGVQYYLRHQRYYDSLMTRLYLYNGSAKEPQPIVVDYQYKNVPSGGQTYSIPVFSKQPIKTFKTMAAAKKYVKNDSSSQIGGYKGYPEKRVPALKHYRVVKESNKTIQLTTGQQSWVKTFERVPGATIKGSGAKPNATVTARVQMKAPSTNQTFSYHQRTTADANGNFEFVVPYSTTGYDNFGPQNGHTNVSVRSTGKYVITSGARQAGNKVVADQATTDVPEGNVVGATKKPISVTLQNKTVLNLGNNSTNASNATGVNGTNASGGNGTNASGGNGTNMTGANATPSTNASTAGNTSTKNKSDVAAPTLIMADVASTAVAAVSRQ